MVKRITRETIIADEHEVAVSRHSEQQQTVTIDVDEGEVIVRMTRDEAKALGQLLIDFADRVGSSDEPLPF